MSPDPEVVEEVAAEMGISSAFVEKDWYSVQALKAIAAHESDGFRTIFSGGTSLSKAYGLIQRFSEDLDFRCLALRSGTGGEMKRARRDYREGILDAVDAVDLLVLDRVRVAAASNYIKFDLGYPQSHEVNSALRAGLKVEFSFTQPRLQAEPRKIHSFVAQYSGTEPEVEILCLSPVETAADKLSALTWRVLKRDRDSAGDDPAMIRHLHDIAALISVIRENRGAFVETVESSFAEDQKAAKRDTQATLRESARTAAQILASDGEYRAEYIRFVDAMSYASDDERVDFDSALEAFSEVGEWFA
jgi:predicted nucleotidyltransferase component of viral defense system